MESTLKAWMLALIIVVASITVIIYYTTELNLLLLFKKDQFKPDTGLDMPHFTSGPVVVATCESDQQLIAVTGNIDYGGNEELIMFVPVLDFANNPFAEDKKNIFVCTRYDDEMTCENGAEHNTLTFRITEDEIRSDELIEKNKAIFMQIMFFKSTVSTADYTKLDKATSESMLGDLLEFYFGAQAIAPLEDQGRCDWLK